MTDTLRQYIRLVLDEVQLARVPNQLVSDKSSNSGGDDEANPENSVQEFSGAGAAVGFALPLGAKAPSVPVPSKTKKK